MKQMTVLILGMAALLMLGGGAEPRQAPPDKPEPPPAVRFAACRWKTGEIKIDGQADEAAWGKAQVLTDFAVFWQNRMPVTATKAHLLWDDEALYYVAEMDDADLYADIKEFNGLTWENDVFELFFKPSVDKRPYYEFQVTPANTRLELFLPSRGAGGYRRFAPLTKDHAETAVKLRGTLNKFDDKDQGWTVEGRIPWTAFAATGGKPQAGAVWKFALCRYDYSIDFERPDLSSTAPLTFPDFHRYEDYGDLKFVGP
jgi:hypothetical protein